MKTIVAFTACLVLFSCASAPKAPDFASTPEGQLWSKLSEFIKTDMERNGIQGLSIAVSTSRGTLWSQGYGKADPASNRPFTTDLISNEGSVSKLVTATAIMLLVEEGKVDLDAPVARYLTDFRPKTRFPEARAITVRDLMTHHSGLPSDYLQGFLPGVVKPDHYPESFLQNTQLVSSLYVATPPGTAFSYSNLAVSLLGSIVETVSGASFEAFCQQRVFSRLNMADSSFVLPADFATNPRFARGPVDGKSFPVPYIRDLPAGALNSTALDMARFVGSYLAAYRGDSGILSQASVKQMFTVQNAGVEADVGFQIGLNFWMVPMDQLPGEFIVGHGGDLDPFHALVLLMPDRDLAVNIQVNSIAGVGSFSLADIAAQALRAAAQATGQTAPAPPKPLAPSKVPSSAEVARWSGTYSTQMGVVRVRPQGSGIQVFVMGLWLDGIPREDGRIGLEAKVLGVKLPISELDLMSLKSTTIGGQPALAILLHGMPFASATPAVVQAVPDAWKARIGDYRVLGPTPGDISDEAKVFVDSETGLLMLAVKAMGRFIALPLQTLSDTEAVTVGYGRNLGETLIGGQNVLNFGGLEFTRK